MRDALFFGWKVVGAAFVVAVLAWGVRFYGPSVFLKALHETRGWSISLISAAVTCHFLMGAATVTYLGDLHRRFGLAPVTAGGGVALAIGLTAWAHAAEPWQLFLATTITGFGWGLTSGAAINAMGTPWS